MTLKTISSCASIFIATVVFAQSPSDPASPPSVPPAGGAGARQGGGGGEQLSQRLMQMDANGDGMLSPEELPPQFAQVFPIVDLNKDGLLDASEIAALAKMQGPPQGPGQGEARGGARGGRGAAGAAPQNFEGAMKQANRGFKGLKASAFDASTKTKDLEQIQLVQAGLITAKGMASSVRMAPQAKAKYGEDVAKYQADMRAQLILTLLVAIDVERAIIAGDSAAAKATVAKLDQAEDAGHDNFRDEEEEEEDAPAPKPANPPAKPAAPRGAN